MPSSPLTIDALTQDDGVALQPLTPEDLSVQTPTVPQKTSGAVDTMGAYYMSETAVGAVTDIFRQSGENDPDFNQYSYIKALPDGPRKAKAMDLLSAGAFDADRLGMGGTSEEIVNNVIDQGFREESRENIIAHAGMGGHALGLGLSFLDVSTFVPWAGGIAKGKSALKAGTAMAGVVGAESAAVEGLLQTAQTDRSATESLMNIGLSTALGGGLGVFARLYANRGLASQIREVMDVDNPVSARVDHSGGAMETPAGDRYANESAVEAGKRYHGQLTDYVPFLKQSPISLYYASSSAGLTRTTAIMQKLGIVGAVEGHKLGQVAGSSVEDVINIKYRTRLAHATQQYHLAYDEFAETTDTGWLNKMVGGPRKAFDVEMALYLEDPSHVFSNPTLERFVREATDGPKGTRSLFDNYFTELNEAGMFPKNLIKQHEEKLAGLEKEVAELQAKADATAPGSTIGDTGKVRRKRTKANEKLNSRIAAKRSKIAGIDAAFKDRRNYFTQSWSRTEILHKRARFVDILAADFADLKHVSDETMVQALHKAGLDTDDLDVVQELFKKDGINSLDEALQVELRGGAATYARQEAENVAREMLTEGNFRLGQLSEGEVKTSRVEGRKLHLSPEAKRAMYEEGMLHSDVPTILRSYTHDVAGKIELKKALDIDDQKGISHLLEEIDDDISGLEASGKLTADQATHYRAAWGIGETDGMLQRYVDRLAGKHDMQDQWDSKIGWGLAQTRKVTTMSSLGGSAISSMTDIATQAYTAGLKRAPGALALHAKYLAGVKSSLAKLPDQDLAIVLSGFENIMEAGRSAQLADTAGSVIRHGVSTGFTRKVTGHVERGLSLGTNKLFSLNLMNRWNQGGKAAAGQVFLGKVLSVGRGGEKLEGKMLEDMSRWGLSEADLKWIGKSETFHPDGFGAEFPATHLWSGNKGAEMRQKLFIALTRSSEEAIITVRKGDLPTFFDGELGKTIGQFTQFGHAWTQRFARKALANGVLPRDVEAAAAVAMMTASGMMIYAIKETIKGRELSDDPAKWIYEAQDRAGLFGAIQAQVSAIYGIASGEVASRYAESGLVGAVFGINAGKVNQAAGAVGSALAGDGVKALEKAQRLVPYQNLFYLDALMRRVFPQN